MEIYNIILAAVPSISAILSCFAVMIKCVNNIGQHNKEMKVRDREVKALKDAVAATQQNVKENAKQIRRILDRVED